MKFPYRQYISQYPGTSDFRLILRAVISVRITGPRVSARWDALVDTGADETLLPLSLGEVLGVVLDRDTTSQAAGITGEPSWNWQPIRCCRTRGSATVP
jgi:hypothetical protein